MKKIIFAVTMVAGISAHAVEKCYVALNPQNITITRFLDEDQKKSIKGTALAAQVRLQNESVEIKSVEAGDTYMGTPWIEFKAQSKYMRFETTAINPNSEDKEQYGVECDGGQVNVKVIGGILVLNSGGLDGEIKNSRSDCGGPGMVVFKDLALAEKACPKK